MFYRINKMDTLGIEPNTSRKFFCYMLSERDNQLHHVPDVRTSLFRHFRFSVFTTVCRAVKNQIVTPFCPSS